MTTPYTYLVYCKPTNQYYYGVRFAYGCSPDDLFKTYFTSSKPVRQLIKKYGINNFLIEVRKVFSGKEEARRWEHRVLKRIDAAKRSDFLNQTDNRCINSTGMVWWNNGTIQTKSIRRPDENWIKGMLPSKFPKRSEDSITKQKETLKKNPRTTKHSEETKKIISANRKGKGLGIKQSEEWIKKRILIGENHGFFGKHHTPEAKLKISESQKNKPKSTEHKNKISAALKGRKKS